MNVSHHICNYKSNSVLQLCSEPLTRVRVGFIGLGVRAKRAVERMMNIDGVEIVAVCDFIEKNINQVQKIITSNGGTKADSFSGEEGWKCVCEHEHIDLVYVCTDWQSHAKIAIYAMQCNKHVALEVPAATTIEECWQLVETAESTRRHCIMLENCCYDEFELSVSVMVNDGVFGEPIHAEGSYLHDLRERVLSNDGGGRKWTNWQIEFMKSHSGNPYPTHGLGPIALTMGIHRGDRMKSIVSVSSKQICCESGSNTLVGNMNSSIITTEKGHTILIRHCISLPHPYSRSFIINGTQGFAQKYPLPHIVLDSEGEDIIDGNKLDTLLNRYRHPIVKRYKDRGETLCGRRWIDYAMDCRLIYCLRNGLPLDMDVYDAAEWSSIVELSQISATNGGIPVDIPDFTRGNWAVLNGHKFHGL